MNFVLTAALLNRQPRIKRDIVGEGMHFVVIDVFMEMYTKIMFHKKYY